MSAISLKVGLDIGMTFLGVASDRERSELLLFRGLEGKADNLFDIDFGL